MKRELPTWSKDAKKALINKDMSVSELAAKIGMTREHTSAVLNGRLLSPQAKTTICKYLNIDDCN